MLEYKLLTTLYELAEATGDSALSMFQLASPSMLVGMYRAPDWGEKREKAILRVLRWVQSTRELREVCESLRVRDVFGNDEQEEGGGGEDDREAVPDGGKVMDPQGGAPGGSDMGPSPGPKTPDQPSIDEVVGGLSSEGPTTRRKLPALLGFAIICMRIDGEEWGDLLGELIRMYFGNAQPGDGEVTPQFEVA